MSTTRTSGYMVSPSDELLGSKLPSRGQSLAYFLHRHQILKETVREAANRTIEKVEEFWARARIPTQDKGRAAKKVETLFDEWKRLKKNKNRTSTTQTGNEDAFKKRLEDIFDIAHGDAMSLITIPEDRAFLLAQREPGRRGTMTGADMALHSQEKRKRRRDDAEEKRRSKASEEARAAADQVELESLTSSSSESSPLRGAVRPGPSMGTATLSSRKRGRTTVITPQLSAMLDRNKVSDRSAIYCIKIWMFRGQFQLTAKEERGLRDMALFVVTMYAKPWFLAPNVLRAAHTDLDLLKTLLNYPQHAIGKATTKKLASHAWYLSEDLVGLAIFDETLPDGEREALRDALAKEGEEAPPKRPSIDLDGLPNKRLADFASQKSKEALTMLGLHVDVLRDPVGTWSSRDDYQSACTMAATLACTNDHAERAVALVQEFSGKLTAEEEQMQWALQVVEENRAKYPDTKKATLLN